MFKSLGLAVSAFFPGRVTSCPGSCHVISHHLPRGWKPSCLLLFSYSTPAFSGNQASLSASRLSLGTYVGAPSASGLPAFQNPRYGSAAGDTESSSGLRALPAQSWVLADDPVTGGSRPGLVSVMAFQPPTKGVAKKLPKTLLLDSGLSQGWKAFGKLESLSLAFLFHSCLILF